ncbi:MAG: hypothetical protein QXT26_07930 [Thermoproteota archaeon]
MAQEEEMRICRRVLRRLRKAKDISIKNFIYDLTAWDFFMHMKKIKSFTVDVVEDNRRRSETLTGYIFILPRTKIILADDGRLFYGNVGVYRPVVEI